MNEDYPHDLGVVLGNGPSRDRNRKHYEGALTMVVILYLKRCLWMCWCAWMCGISLK